MKKSLYTLTLALVLAGTGSVTWGDDSENIEYKRVSISGQFDNGQIIKGSTNQYDLVSNETMRGNFFQRTGVWITQEAVVRDRLTLTMGVGGVFWYALPINPDDFTTRQTQFGPGISQAQAVYAFGDVDNPSASLQMGFFPYKYNADAKNLGEYLMRSGTYPGYVVTGGWNMLNSAGYMVQGARLNVPLWGGKFQSDFILAMERDLPPLFGITPAYVATLKPVAGVTLGAGVACNHCIAVKPSSETPHVDENRIITGRTVTTDTILGEVYYGVTYDRDTTGRYYTLQGLKVMGSASFDPKAYVPMPFLGEEDLKIYGEIAVLGWKNYDYLYEKRTERMPMMVGVNLPTFKFLDLLSFELEYYNNKFVNNYRNLVYGGVPTWYLPGDDGTGVTGYVPEDEFKQNESDARRDNWKWSLYGKKVVTKGIDIYAQVASDHIRTIAADRGPFPTNVPITNRNGKDWYYIVRLQFGI